MTPARNRSRTMKIKLMTMAITRPLQTVDTQGKTRPNQFHGPLYGDSEEAGDRLTAKSSAMTECNPQRFSWPPGAPPLLHLIFCSKKEKRRISIVIQEA